MPVILKRVYQFKGDYTEDEKIQLQIMVDMFRLRMSDDIPDKNILNKCQSEYSDERIVRLLYTALDDLNGGTPKTNYSLFEFITFSDNDLVVMGAMVFALIGEGILQLRNQVDFSDSGISIAMFNKTGAYQGWANFILQQYMQSKAQMKSTIISTSPNSGFVGIHSEFSYYGWW